ncbi:MAG: hypothetical protein ABI262_16780 [Microcoleus sp.]
MAIALHLNILESLLQEHPHSGQFSCIQLWLPLLTICGAAIRANQQ